VVALANPTEFANRASGIAEPAAVPHATRPEALEHVIRTQAQLTQAGREIRSKLQGQPALPTEFPRTNIGGQLSTAARLILSGLDVPVIKVSIGSFDTHVYQRTNHNRLLRELADGLAAFRATMIARARWDDVLVLTYSEFGRRPAENGGTPTDNNSSGTDHGTAAPHFALGGRVRGGLIGRQPSLDALEAQDLRYTMDFRQVFSTVAQRWWGVDADRVVGTGHDPIRLFA
jgi:uncharacterized protein (DUF1501 family)